VHLLIDAYCADEKERHLDGHGQQHQRQAAHHCAHTHGLLVSAASVASDSEHRRHRNYQVDTHAHLTAVSAHLRRISCSCIIAHRASDHARILAILMSGAKLCQPWL